MMQNKQTKFCCREGFTLLELIVAMALMDVIAVALYACMHTAFKSKESAQASLKPYRSVMPVFEHIRKDFTSAMKPDGILAGVFEGNDVSFTDLQDADTLGFYTACYHPKEDEIASNVIYVQYTLENDDERDQIVLKRLTTKNLLSPTATEAAEEVIARNITGLDIQYFDGTAWLDNWDSSEEDATLPWGVKVTVSMIDENRGRFSKNDDPYRYFTRVYMLPFANQAAAATTNSEL